MRKQIQSQKENRWIAVIFLSWSEQLVNNCHFNGKGKAFGSTGQPQRLLEPILDGSWWPSKAACGGILLVTMAANQDNLQDIFFEITALQSSGI